MVDYSTTLLRSLRDRAGTLGSYVRKLQSAHSRRNDAYAAALEMFHRYTELVVRQADAEWHLSLNSGTRHDILVRRIGDFFEKEHWFDERFARGSQSDVPRALNLLARRELRGHGLNDYEPVLTVGPPDSFETHRTDLSAYLFGDLYEARASDFVDLPTTRLAIISVPYIEGTRALWYPISVGHELGHVRIEAQRGVLPELDFRQYVDPVDVELAYMEAPEYWGESIEAGLGVLQTLRSATQAWVEELLCDLNTVRLFGPAGLASIAEFLAVLRPEDPHGPNAPSDTHPPLRTRLTVMFGFLAATGTTSMPDHVAPWLDYVDRDRVKLGPNSAYVESVILGNLDELVAHAMTWGDIYFRTRRDAVVSWARDELLGGVPAGTHCLGASAMGERVEVADVVNASWEAGSHLEDNEAEMEQPAVTPSALAEARLTPHERRVTLDQLAGKAIDTLEYATRWRAAGGEVINVADFDDEPFPASGGVLSRRVMCARLRASGPSRLVVTPLFDNSLNVAAIDLRLGPDFIVQRHSATTDFDPLRREQDPRVMQEVVDKAWDEPFILHPHELVLASTLEYVVLPYDVSAQVTTRSSYGRLGLITATAVQVQPGSPGCITLELTNVGETPIALRPGARIAQIVLMHVPDAEPTTPGKYAFPVGPEFSKVQQDPDSDILRNIASDAYRSAPMSRGATADEAAVSFELVGSFNEATFYQSIVQAEGGLAAVSPIADFGVSPDESNRARLIGGESIITYVTAGSIAAGAMVSAVLRLVRGLKRGVVITVLDDATVSIKSATELPRGVVVITASSGVSQEVQIMAASGPADLASSLSRALPQRTTGGRWREEDE